MEIGKAKEEAEAVDGRLVFAPVNMERGQDLPVDDLAALRLAFIHAVRQVRNYTLPLENDEAVATVASGLYAVDWATCQRKRKGLKKNYAKKLDARAEQLKAVLKSSFLEEISVTRSPSGKTREGALERYVPAACLAANDRATLGGLVHKEVLRECPSASAGSAEADADNAIDGSAFSVLTAQGKAVSLMQAWLPDFECYLFEPVTQAKEDFWGVWNSADNSGRCDGLVKIPKDLPQGHFAVDGNRPDAEYRLLLNRHGLELRPIADEGRPVQIGFNRGPVRQHLVGWQLAAEDSVLVLALFAWDRDETGAPVYAPREAGLTMPQRSARSTAALLWKLASSIG